MSATNRRIARRLALWLIAGGGLEELRERDVSSRHIDELMGARWRPTRREMLETALRALTILRDSRLGTVSHALLLKIPIRKTRFHIASPLSFSSIEARLERDVHRFGRGRPEPPELFVYGGRGAGSLIKWLDECVALKTDEVTLKNLMLAAVPIRRIRKRSGAGLVTTDLLILLARVARPLPRLAMRARAA